MITVIMSVFNESEIEIKEAVNSILKQTYKNFELIIVNDNPSFDVMNNILNSVAQLDERIRIIKNNENIGLALSMNKAAAIAKGDFLARMDADDICELTRFETEVNVLKEKNVDLVFSNFYKIDDNGNALNMGLPVQTAINKDNLLQEIVFRSYIHHPTVMMKKCVFDKVGGYRNFPCAQDKDLWLRLIEAGCRFYWVEDCLLKYRIRANSITRQKQIRQYVTLEYIMHLFVERIAKKGFDSYSIEGYEAFVKSRNIDSRYLVKTFKIAQRLLIDSKNRSIVLGVLYRLVAFIVSATHRNYYLYNLFHKRRINQYLKNKRDVVDI